MAQVGTGASGVFIEEEKPGTPAIQGVSTSSCGFLGIAERGPFTPYPISSPDEYEQVFGGDIADGDLSHSVRGFFLEGGLEASVCRTAHYMDPSDASTRTSVAAELPLQTDATGPTSASVLGTTSEPFQLAPGLTLPLVLNGGSAATATFQAANAHVDTSTAGPYALTNGMTLTLVVAGVMKTLTFSTAEFVSIGAATRAELAASLNAKLGGAAATDITTAVRIATDQKGTGASINITGGTANAVLGFPTGATAGTGNVADIDHVMGAEVKVVVEAAIPACTVTVPGGKLRFSSNTTGTSSSIQVQPASTAREELGLDTATHTGSTGAAQDTLQVVGRYEGAYANKLKLRIQAASNGEASDFNLQMMRDGLVVGTYPNLSMDPASSRYIETILNGDKNSSQLVAVSDLGLVGTATQRRPVNGTFGPMVGGDDGLVGISDSDFVGDVDAGTGLYAMDKERDIRLLVVSDRPTAVVHNAIVTYCSVHRGGSLFPVFDTLPNMTARDAITYVVSTANLLNASEFGAMYWPWVLVANPDKTIYGAADTIPVPPAGHVAGVFARVDASQAGGIYQPPAGTERGRFRSVLGLETDEALDSRKMDLLYPKRINPLTSEPGVGPYINGVRTLKADGNFPTIAERRGVIFIEQSLIRGTQFARFANNDDALRRRLERACEAFLRAQMNANAFRSMNPETAFFVDFGPGLNPDSVIFENKVVGRIGLATQKPAEFILLRISQDTRGLNAELAA